MSIFKWWWLNLVGLVTGANPHRAAWNMRTEQEKWEFFERMSERLDRLDNNVL